MQKDIMFLCSLLRVSFSSWSATPLGPPGPAPPVQNRESIAGHQSQYGTYTVSLRECVCICLYTQTLMFLGVSVFREQAPEKATLKPHRELRRCLRCVNSEGQNLLIDRVFVETQGQKLDLYYLGTTHKKQLFFFFLLKQTSLNILLKKNNKKDLKFHSSF